ncbi:LytR/AlgR family response regulator transcription factor [Anaerocolumna chitinilytica]|uniref:Stage 0 sporulation protein A homolog n=1 Tax=Anaerocolumna chitinilytica TaxID=1727145 RepID=A0A7I8DGE7_9FIRM|nr:LytTR family DNA-binding domain-containing protein [Anaerocolumna chitinilytica]BCJ97593.1 DNA-binding response regulator [Anaerocolumna chitinilytica]
MIKIALCDDDKKALPIIAGAAESTFRAQRIHTELQCFLNGEELLKAMEHTHFQIVLLDIDMPGLDGIEVGKRIREGNNNTCIIYVSECENRVFESFAVQPLGFVRKSNFLNDIAAVVQLYIKNCMQDQNVEYIKFSTRNSILTLKSNQIRYIEGSRNYQKIFLTGQQEPMEIKMTMEKLEYLTEPHGFIRIHKGYLVNYLYIQRIQTNHLILQDGITLPIGRSKMGEVKSKFISMLGN